MEEPGGLQSTGLLRARHNWVTSLSFSCIGEGNGNLLQCSCLENPRDREAWWAAIYGVAQSRTQLRRLSSSSSKKRDSFECLQQNWKRKRRARNLPSNHEKAFIPPYRLQPARLICPWGFSRQEYWSGLPCPPPGESSPSRDPAFVSWVSCVGRQVSRPLAQAEKPWETSPNCLPCGNAQMYSWRDRPCLCLWIYDVPVFSEPCSSPVCARGAGSHSLRPLLRASLPGHVPCGAALSFNLLLVECSSSPLWRGREQRPVCIKHLPSMRPCRWENGDSETWHNWLQASSLSDSKHCKIRSLFFLRESLCLAYLSHLVATIFRWQ